MKKKLKKIAYSLANIAAGGKGIQRTVNGFKVKFPAAWSRYYESDYEKENYEFLKRQAKPGMDIIDIGAHLGLFSVVSSVLVGDNGRIICFEPTPGTYAVLSETLRLNECKNVIPVRGAVAKEEGLAVFYVSETAGCNSNSLIKNSSDKQAQGNEVKVYSIDGIVSQHSLKPGLIKIDAEGAELDVLEGGMNTFGQFKPILILGLHPDFIKKKGDSIERIWDLLQLAGYQVKDNDKEITKSDFCNRELIFDVQCT
jgi:FkbM family methyltransferase